MENNKLPKVGRYLFLAEPFHCNFKGMLFPGHLGNHMLNAADFHSDERGYGMSKLLPQHKTWVLSRLVLEMQETPKVYDKFYIETWVDGIMKFFTTRNYSVVSPEGKVFGYGKSIWALIDTDTRKPSDLLELNEGAILNYVEKEKECPIDNPSHVKIGKQANRIKSVKVSYSDIDMNGHVNSMKYLEHALDIYSLDYWGKKALRRLEIAYIIEAYYGCTLHFYEEEVSADHYHIRVTKSDESSEEETDVCRIAFIFEDNK